MNGGDAVEQRREIAEEAAAEFGDLVRRQPAKVTLERLRPDPERRRFPQGVGARGKADDPGAPSSEKLAGEARLPDARVRKQQDDAKLCGADPLKLAPELPELGTSAHQFGRPGHRRNYPQNDPFRSLIGG